jgi:hypothetical protein
MTKYYEYNWETKTKGKEITQEEAQKDYCVEWCGNLMYFKDNQLETIKDNSVDIFFPQFNKSA